MELWIRIAQLMLSITLLVFVHELGHFVPAKLFKIRVSKFYIFFDFLFPLPNVLPFSLFKKKIGETEYGLGWFPFGGYVQIDGMVDESMDVEKLKEEPKPWEFRSKPVWQRFIVMVGGVTVNVIVAILIYIGLLWWKGETFLPMKNATYGIWITDSVGYKLGLMNGDKILKVGDKPIEDFDEFTKEVILSRPKDVTIERNDSVTVLSVPQGFVGELVKFKKEKQPLILPRIPIEIKDVVKGQPAEKSGLHHGDRIVGVNNNTIQYFDELQHELALHKNEPAVIHYVRNSDTLATDSLRITKEGKIGIAINDSLPSFFELKNIHYSFFGAIPAGFEKAYTTLSNYIQQFGLLFSGEVKAKDSLGGFGSFTKMFSPQWDWVAFWNMTALISIILAFMNILPIPALDGGHIVFLIYEGIFRRPPPQKVMEYAQIVGMILLFGLMIYANGLDVFRAWFQK